MRSPFAHLLTTALFTLSSVTACEVPPSDDLRIDYTESADINFADTCDHEDQAFPLQRGRKRPVVDGQDWVYQPYDLTFPQAIAKIKQGFIGIRGSPASTGTGYMNGKLVLHGDLRGPVTGGSFRGHRHIVCICSPNGMRFSLWIRDKTTPEVVLGVLLIFREIGIENIDKIVFWDRESALYRSGKARLMNRTTWCFPPGYRSVKPAEGYVNETICVIEEALATYALPDEAADHLTQWISAMRELASGRQGS